MRIAAAAYAALVFAWAIIDPSVAGRLAQGLTAALALALLAVVATHRRDPLDEVASLAFVPSDPSIAVPSVPPEVIDLVTAIGGARTYIPPLVVTRIRDIATSRLDDHHRIELSTSEVTAPDVVPARLWSVIDPVDPPSGRAGPPHPTRLGSRTTGGTVTTHDRGSAATTTITPLDAADAAARIAAIVDEVERAVVGKRDRIELVLAALLAGGHVLLDDVPGVAKTLMARSIASATGLTFSRVQFTPDVLPSDITGATVLDLTTRAPVFRAGPLFAQIVLADEINRAPAKTQAALLEAMQEAQVTADGVSHPLPDPFWVIATENPVESEGTYPLPEAQLDRFLVRTTIGYPTHDDEVEIVARRLSRTSDRIDLDAVSSNLDLAQVRATIEAVHVDPSVIDHAVRITTASRRHRDLSLGVSPRGTVALVTLARSHAVVQGRDFVTPDDVRQVALPALAHRVALSDEAWARGLRNDDVMRSVVDSVAAPSWE